MREKIYLRIAKTRSGYKYKADKKKNLAPLDNGTSYDKTYFPTIVVALNLEISDRLFREALTELDLQINNPDIASEINIEEHNRN